MGVELAHGVQSLKLGSSQRQLSEVKVELKLVESNTHTPSWRDKLERQNPVKQETEAAQVWGYEEMGEPGGKPLHRAIGYI